MTAYPAVHSLPHAALRVAAIIVLLLLGDGAHAQASWRVDARVATGPVAQVEVPNVGTKRRGALVAFEYARRCDPIFSFAEIAGAKLGKPVGQSVLTGTKIGVVVNGKFYTWHAAISRYDNGWEAGFGVTNELYDVLKAKVDSLVYVTPDGEQVSLPIAGFRQALQSAFEACARRFK